MTQETDEKCSKCGCEIGHFIDCPDGACFTQEGLKNQNKSLDFLDDEKEDIYTESDGTKLEKEGKDG